MMAGNQVVVPLTALPRRSKWRRFLLVAASAPLLLATTGYVVRLPEFLPGPEANDRNARSQLANVAVPEIALATQLMPVSAEEAERLNAQRATDVARVVAARPFAVKDQFREDPRFHAALQCLTQAIYYEAGYEPDPGQRAVAQVVLNRVRHPAFPHSICGVVYQGSELPTGCQFTFTCDGSLLRQPSPSAWARARGVALAALSGWVEASVGLSTHYHATYVVPYWAPTLSKVKLVGQHIFYSFPGGGGNAAAFRAGYDFSSEFAPAASSLAAQPLEPADEVMEALPERLGGTRTAQSDPKLEADRTGAIETERSLLRADQERGVLTVRGADSRLVVD
jgi:spore germination cell wall hydrolase CwlJ-like protein